MHDTLEYFARDPVHRRWHHHELTFRAVYRASENFVLPLSHDEVVHGKGSLLSRMVGDDDQRFANLRLLLAYQWMQPGKKLLFAGGEFGPRHEWSHEHPLALESLDHPAHGGVFRLVQDLNARYRDTPALHDQDCEPGGFEWVDSDDAEHSTLAFLRWATSGAPVLVVANFTPLVRQNHRIGVPIAGHWREIINTDAAAFGGRGVGNLGGADTVPAPAHGRVQSLVLTVPPLGLVALEPAPA
jgi:1,4-alpha-glucan branching enzyme